MAYILSRNFNESVEIVILATADKALGFKMQFFDTILVQVRAWQVLCLSPFSLKKKWNFSNIKKRLAYEILLCTSNCAYCYKPLFICLHQFIDLV